MHAVRWGSETLINMIWAVMIGLGVVLAFGSGPQATHTITQGIMEGAENAVAFAFGLIGVLAFWSGMLKVAQEAGLTEALGRLIAPVVRKLFPSIPKNHAANASILMALCANMLGLGNAATPLGLKAMEDLADLNGRSSEASDAMCTFLALSTSGLTLLPGTVIAVRAAAGSNDPTSVVGATVVATSVSTLTAIIADRMLRRGRKA